MKNIILSTLAAMGVAAIWGYFTDLSKGNVSGFIARIFFVAAFIFALQLSMYRGRKKNKEKNNSNKVGNNGGKNKKKGKNK
ncbi:hypothetical protein BD780_002705 [Clostridium tetanomorphum]|uniref:Uncharacterized protein n=1 Tax=Clostridium tetanomorphum TaxID=1553 RepID=A0A923EDZ1_CLOTT|nr:hypothetical protein [Clostridium tetanomorphum]KAJ50605.1 hypothetical protein CTM_16712 [Clostridium tetanomorphum DSM 665]MBC2399065.1 hypothetical protein [Clostridium tetanomorphum]MBP1862680.1 hypothetical protein [Clostridium tetanomorphum]NRS85480.1 hypothetical protein [Clostridium tetanomorphum]NRZ98594.1 hypothetical protein [Clostridium tetanomorphum]